MYRPQLLIDYVHDSRWRVRSDYRMEMGNSVKIDYIGFGIDKKTTMIDLSLHVNATDLSNCLIVVLTRPNVIVGFGST